MERRLLMWYFLGLISISGCSLLNFPQLNAPRPPDTTYQYHERFETNPTAVVAGDKIAIVESQLRTVDAGYVNTKKELNFWQRFCNWLASWSIITVFVVFGCLAFGVTGPAVWFMNRFRTFTKTTKQLVRGMEKAQAVEKQPELKTTLAAMLDNDSKKLIDDIRRE